MKGLALGGYYAILDVVGDTRPDQESLRRRAHNLLAAQPCCLQLRAKQLGAAALREAAAIVLGACRAADVPFCLNDRLDVALSVGADMVHLGQDDLPLADARRLAEDRLWIGISTHNLAQARAAAAGGADYIGFGPVFGTGSKRNPDPVVGLAGLRAVTEALDLPVVAIGGITLETAPLVAAAGARAAAVIAAVERAPDPTLAGRRVAEAFPRA